MVIWKTSPNDLGRAGTCSDRALEKAIQLRLDLLYFIDHDIGEAPPDHSTICKTRKRIPADVFAFQQD
jgi:IS5 family transposase